MKTKTENSRIRVCAIAREGEGQNRGRRKVRTRRAKVGKLERKVVRFHPLVLRFCSCTVRVFGLLRLDLEQEEDGHGDHGEAQHIARGDAQHTVHFASGRHLGELPTAECVADEEADEEEQADSQLPQWGGEERRREEHDRIGASDGDEAQEERFLHCYIG